MLAVLIAGIDFSTFAVDFVFIPLDPRVRRKPRHTRVELRAANKSGDLESWKAARVTRERIEAAQISEFEETVLAFIERGHGKSRNNDWILGRVQGAILAALPQNVRDVTWETDIGEWKREFTGVYTASKEQVTEKARSLGFDLPDDNAYDALGIAYSMRAKNEAAVKAAMKHAKQQVLL